MCSGLLSSFSMVISQDTCMLDHLKFVLISEILWNLLSIHLVVQFSWIPITQATTLHPEQIIKCYSLYCIST